MPMNLDSIRAKVTAYLEDPDNEDQIAEAIALETVRVSSPAILQGASNPMLETPEGDDSDEEPDQPGRTGTDGG